jgi:hypothetical protein
VRKTDVENIFWKMYEIACSTKGLKRPSVSLCNLVDKRKYTIAAPTSNARHMLPLIQTSNSPNTDMYT